MAQRALDLEGFLIERAISRGCRIETGLRVALAGKRNQLLECGVALTKLRAICGNRRFRRQGFRLSYATRSRQ
jgi:hypothetical protein